MSTETKVVTPEGMPDSSHLALGWLWSLTDPDPKRPKLTRPWTLALPDGPVTCATNGTLLAVRAGAFGFDAMGADDFIRVMTAVKGPVYALDVAALRSLACPTFADVASCAICADTGTVRCKECSGDGFTECLCVGCENTHDADCDACDGDGKMACLCPRGVIHQTEFRPCDIGPARFNLNLLAKALPHVVGDMGTLQLEHPETVALLTVGDWRLYVMPMRIRPEETDVPRFALGEVQS